MYGGSGMACVYVLLWEVFGSEASFIKMGAIVCVTFSACLCILLGPLV